jgi:hypothetical protein
MEWTVSVDSTITRVHQHGARHPDPGHRRDRGLDRVTRILIAAAISSRLTTRSAAPEAVTSKIHLATDGQVSVAMKKSQGRPGPWGWCSPAATLLTPPSPPPCSTPPRSATGGPADLASGPSGCWPTSRTPPRPIAAISLPAASKSPSPNARPEGRPHSTRLGRRTSLQLRPGGLLYKGRNVVERCFNKLKQWRGIATRFDKTARSYLAGLTLAAALIWTR